MAARSVPECGAAGAQGWNIDFGTDLVGLPQVQAGDSSGTRESGGAVLDTLLGPEGSDDTRRLELVWPFRGSGLLGWCVWAGFSGRGPCRWSVVRSGCGVPVVF